jgi:hypothetical protein
MRVRWPRVGLHDGHEEELAVGVRNHAVVVAIAVAAATAVIIAAAARLKKFSSLMMMLRGAPEHPAVVGAASGHAFRTATCEVACKLLAPLALMPLITEIQIQGFGSGLGTLVLPKLLILPLLPQP